MPSSRMNPAAVALAARSGWSAGGLGAVVGSVAALLSGLGMSLLSGTTEVVVGLATATGWPGLSRPTTQAVATPIPTASTPAAATRRVCAGRISAPRSTLLSVERSLQGSRYPVTKADRRHLGHVPKQSPVDLGSGCGPLPGHLYRFP